MSRAGQEAGDALERGAGKLNKWLDDFDRWYNERFGKGSTFGERFGNWPGASQAPGADKPLPLFGKGWDQMRPSENIEDVRGRGEVLETNTRQLSRLRGAPWRGSNTLAPTPTPATAGVAPAPTPVPGPTDDP